MRYPFKPRFFVILAAFAAVIVIAVAGCHHSGGPTSREKLKSESSTVTLIAVGDDLIHDTVFKSCRTADGYDFSPLYKNISKYAGKADLAVINQETMLVNANYSGYPMFGTPMQISKYIEAAGFNVVTHATNHAMDRGSDAIAKAAKHWSKKHKKITMLGIHASRKDADRIRVINKKGMRIALLNYTYGLNGISIPSDKAYMVDMLTDDNKENIKADIKAAKKKADFIIVFPHWGTEYQYDPDESQKSWAQFFANQGVDLVIGAHPHVVEPVKEIKDKKSCRTMVCYYLLGNYISSQDTFATMLGGMANVTIIKNEKGTHIKKYNMEPIVTQIGNGYSSYTTYKLSDYTDELAEQNYISVATGSKATVAKFQSLFKQIANSNGNRSSGKNVNASGGKSR